MNQTTGCNNIFSVSPPVSANSCSQSLLCSNTDRCESGGISRTTTSSSSSCRTRATTATAAVERSSHTAAVIVSPPSVHHQQQQNSTTPGDVAVHFEGPGFYGTTSPYAATTQHYFANDSAGTSPAVFQAPNFLQPYYGLPQTLSDFNMFHMCYQPFLSEISSPGTESSPTAESIYGFANRLQPISSAGPHSQQFVMPQAYPQSRNGYMSSTVPRPGSAAGKRGGRRPKECEEYDVTMSEEEKDKRDKRRLRNKEAAARCRQRRLDLMGSLQNQVDQLKEDNKMKDSRIAELQMLKNELLSVIREHQCVLPENLRQSLEIDLSNTYIPRSSAHNVSNTDMQFTAPPLSHPPMISRKRHAPSDMVSDFRPNQDHLSNHSTSLPLNANTISKTPHQIKQEPSFKADPTLYSVNGRDMGEDELKRPTSLFDKPLPVTSANYGVGLTSGVPITTPSNINGEFAAPNGLLEGPTGLTPMHPQPLTAFTGSITPLNNDGQSYAAL